MFNLSIHSNQLYLLKHNSKQPLISKMGNVCTYLLYIIFVYILTRSIDIVLECSNCMIKN